MRDEIAVIVPVYNGTPFLDELCARTVAALSQITDRFSIVLIDDVAPDNPWPKMREICARDKRIKAVRLSRNFGQHNALTAGIDLANANWYVVMDCDLQDAPEDILLLYNKAKEGHDVVVAHRPRRNHPLFKKIMSSLYWSMFNAMSGVKLDPTIGIFRIFSNRVADGFRDMREQIRILTTSFEWMGYAQERIELPHHVRAHGKTSYNFSRNMRLAAYTIMANSIEPLKWTAYLGFAMSFLSFVVGVFYIVRTIFVGGAVEGWPSLFVAIMFMGSVQIALMGILGVYLGKTFEETKRRPLYLIQNTLNLDDDEAR